MSKKNMKVFEIKARAASGNLRTVHAMAPLDYTLNDCCKASNIPMLSIIAVKVSAPMCAEDAFDYVVKHQIAVVTDPSVTFAKTSIKMMAA